MGKVLQGRVVAASNDKTVSVLVSTPKVHPIYKKRFTISKKYAVHDEQNKAKIDDLVIIEEIKPVSKSKRWGLKEITGSAAIAHQETEVEEAKRVKQAPEPKAAKKTEDTEGSK